MAEWCYIAMPDRAKADLFRSDFEGTIAVEPDVPPVEIAEPVELSGGRWGWCCHWWARTEAARDLIATLAEYPRYSGVVAFAESGSTPSWWDPVSREV